MLETTTCPDCDLHLVSQALEDASHKATDSLDAKILGRLASHFHTLAKEADKWAKASSCKHDHSGITEQWRFLLAP